MQQAVQLLNTQAFTSAGFQLFCIWKNLQCFSDFLWNFVNFPVNFFYIKYNDSFPLLSISDPFVVITGMGCRCGVWVILVVPMDCSMIPHSSDLMLEYGKKYFDAKESKAKKY